MDEVYNLAKNSWLVKRENAEIFFETNNNGMISLCSYVENGCQDGCSVGIQIISIAKLTD